MNETPSPEEIKQGLRTGYSFDPRTPGLQAAARDLLRPIIESMDGQEIVYVCRFPRLMRVAYLEVDDEGYLDDIGLGAKCAINADGQRTAKYSLRTPINRFVWRKLAGLPLSIALISDIPAIKAIDLDALPKLTKANAKDWADKALMPYLTAMYENFSDVPEFSAILHRPGVNTRGQQRREIRKDIIRALQSLAPAA